MFSLGGAQCNHGLELGGPKEGASCNHDDTAGSRFHTSRILLVFRIPKTGKRGITVAVHGQASGGFHDQALVASASQVPQDHLDSCGMTLFVVLG